MKKQAREGDVPFQEARLNIEFGTKKKVKKDLKTKKMLYTLGKLVQKEPLTEEISCYFDLEEGLNVTWRTTNTSFVVS